MFRLCIEGSVTILDEYSDTMVAIAKFSEEFWKVDLVRRSVSSEARHLSMSSALGSSI